MVDIAISSVTVLMLWFRQIIGFCRIIWFLTFSFQLFFSGMLDFDDESIPERCCSLCNDGVVVIAFQKKASAIG